MGFLATLQYWGVIGIFVGVIMGVVGIVPLGMLASAFHSDWSTIGMLALGLVLTFGARMAASMVAKMVDRDEAGWVVTGVVAGVIAVGAFSGVVALSALNGASQFGPALPPETTPQSAESVYVKYRGEVDLKSIDCTDIARSNFIRRVCYDEANEYMLINLNGTYYHYCAIDAGTVSAFRAADSMGRFYNASIKANFDCRKNQAPEYPQEPGVNGHTATPGGATPPPTQREPTTNAAATAPSPGQATPSKFNFDAQKPYTGPEWPIRTKKGTTGITRGAEWSRITPVTPGTESGPFDGRWSATVGPQGVCNFTSILILDVLGSSIVGNATNPLGVFPLSGTVDPNGKGVFKIGTFVGTIRFLGTTFEANYANSCGGRFATGRRHAAENVN